MQRRSYGGYVVQPNQTSATSTRLCDKCSGYKSGAQDTITSGQVQDVVGWGKPHCIPLDLNLPARSESIAENPTEYNHTETTKTRQHKAQRQALYKLKRAPEQRIARVRQQQQILHHDDNYDSLTNKERRWWGYTIRSDTPKCTIKPRDIHAEDIRATASTIISLHRIPSRQTIGTKQNTCISASRNQKTLDHQETKFHGYNESEGDDLHRWWLYNLEAVNAC